MPLRAILDGFDIQAFNYHESDWDKLKRSYKNRSLKVVCCDRSAIPKKSKLGTQYFAHAKRGDCSTAIETADHIKLKTIIAEAVAVQGWEVCTEYPGAAPDGQKWVADVMCMKGNAKLAIEIQWSNQTLDEFLRRTERYKRSGVRCLWLFRLRGNRNYKASDFIESRDLPYFGFRAEDCGYTVSRYGIPVQEFVKGMLTGELVCAPMKNHSLIYQFFYSSERCWRCDKKSNCLTKLVVKTSAGHEVYKKRNTHSSLLEWVYHNVHESVLRPYQIGPIRYKLSPIIDLHRYYSSCIHCGEELGGLNSYLSCDIDDYDMHIFELPNTAFKAQIQYQTTWFFAGNRGRASY